MKKKTVYIKHDSKAYVEDGTRPKILSKPVEPEVLSLSDIENFLWEIYIKRFGNTRSIKIWIHPNNTMYHKALKEACESYLKFDEYFNK